MFALNLLPTNGFSLNPVEVKLLAREQKATEKVPFQPKLGPGDLHLHQYVVFGREEKPASLILSPKVSSWFGSDVMVLT